MSRIMIAGTGSGSGKTTIVCGLCRCIKDLGRTPTALKCGPDYIDAMFHSRVLKMRTGNLDSWFCDKTTIRTLLAKKEKSSDITVIEGVMGYYDGAGFSTKGSSFEIAQITDTPVILIVNCRGISNSVGAVLKGFTTFQENSQIRGVIFNQMSEKLYPQAKKAAQELGADLTVNPIEEDLHKIVMDATNGMGADVIVMAIGVPALVNSTLKLCKKGGTVNLFAGFAGTGECTIEVNTIHYNEINVNGSTAYKRIDYLEAADMVINKKINLDRIATDTFKLDEFKEAFEYCKSGQGLKVMIEP